MVPAAHTGDAVDRKGQRLIADRFRAHHRERLDRIRATLEPEPRLVFDALALLIHVNHPALPGFVDHDVPAGIDRYTPDDVAVAAARRIALSYAPERLIERARHVQAVLLEPAATPSDPHRLLVCCRESHHEALERKLSAIRGHASRAGLALSTQLVDPLAIRAGSMKLGTTPALALDRFYLDALALAGRYPLWWLVPVGLSGERHAEHARRLQQQRFVAPDEAFDFGPVPIVGADEWLEASVGLLERALTEPFGALRQLQLIEARTSNASAAMPGLLSELYKAEIHRDRKIDSAALDSAALTRREVERHFGRDPAQHVRLEHAKRLHSDGFGIERDWSIARRIEESRLMQQELDRALRLATAFRERASRQVQSTEQRLQRVHDLLLPARTGANHIPMLHAALLENGPATAVSVDRLDERWRIREAHTTLFSTARLVGVAVWLHLHGVGPERVRIDDPETHARLERLLAVMRSHPKTPARLLIVNAEREPMREQLMPEEALVSEWDDPLDYSGYHHNLVVSVDRVELGRGATHDGDDGALGLARAFEHVLAHDSDGVALRCIGAVQSRAIESRIRELTAELRAAFHGDSAAGRFVFPSGAGYTVATRSATGISFATTIDDNGLMAALRAPLPARRPVTLADSRSRRLAWLRQLAELIDVGRAVLLVVEEENTPLTLYLCDQDGSIHRYAVPGRTTEQLGGELSVFLQRQRLNAAALPKLYSSSPRGLAELRVPPDSTLPRVSLRVRREPGRVDLFHGERRWSNVAINETLLDELLTVLGPRRQPGAPVAAVGDVAFEAETPRLPDLLALKLGFERLLAERIRRP